MSDEKQLDGIGMLFFLALLAIGCGVGMLSQAAYGVLVSSTICIVAAFVQSLSHSYLKRQNAGVCGAIGLVGIAAGVGMLFSAPYLLLFIGIAFLILTFTGFLLV